MVRVVRGKKQKKSSTVLPAPAAPPREVFYYTPADFYGIWHMQGIKNISADGKKLFFDETIVITEDYLYIETDSNFKDFLYLEINSWTPELNPTPKIKRKEYAAGFRLTGVRAPTSIGYKFDSLALYINKKKTSLVRRVLDNEVLPRFYIKIG